MFHTLVRHLFSFARETINDGLNVITSPTKAVGLLKAPLYKNSVFLIASSTSAAGSGFFFWVIAARFYSAEEVGLASAIISAMGLVSLLSLLGFDISLVRFLPEREDKQEPINSCLTISLRRA